MCCRKYKNIILETMKALLLKLSLLPLFITGCTNVTVQAPQQAALPTVATAKTLSEPSKPAVVEVSEPSTTISTRSTSSSTCNYYTGKAIEGQSVNVDLCSVSPKSSGAISFVYALGSKRMESEANCADATWTTVQDRQTHRPQSLATEKMINKVCGDRGANQIVS